NEFNDFIESSKYSKVFKYRIVLDFQKIIDSVSDKQDICILESWLIDIYYELSAYKSPKFLDIIKVFLFNKRLISFDVNNYPWSVKILDNWYYYNDDILNYYFDSRRCHDCGVSIKKISHNYCSTCTARRSLKKLCAKSNLEKTFKKVETEMFFLEFVNFMLKSQLQFNTVHAVSKLLVHAFLLIEKKINVQRDKKVISFKDNTYWGGINKRWICSTFESYSSLPLTQKDLTTLPAAYGHFVAFVKSKYIISSEEVLPYLKIENKQIVMVASEKNYRGNIEERIYSRPRGYRKLLIDYLEMKSKKIYVLEKKNAVKTLKWKSVSTLFESFFRFIDWLK